jgi:ketosteroid isomerase-like protein
VNENVLKEWLAGYRRAWESRDADAAARLFASDAEYFETPYSEPFRGPDGVRRYWASVTADQRDVSFSSETVGVVGDTGIARWKAKFSLASSGATIEMDGVFLLEFGAAGKCKSLREWWHAR